MSLGVADMPVVDAEPAHRNFAVELCSSVELSDRRTRRHTRRWLGSADSRARGHRPGNAGCPSQFGGHRLDPCGKDGLRRRIQARGLQATGAPETCGDTDEQQNDAPLVHAGGLANGTSSSLLPKTFVEALGCLRISTLATATTSRRSQSTRSPNRRLAPAARAPARARIGRRAQGELHANWDRARAHEELVVIDPLP
jgi:hypothetical protein